MRNKQHAVSEIVQLSAIKASCNHFLASQRSLFEVENTTQLRKNLCVINRSLRDLYEELEVINKKQTGKGEEAAMVRAEGKGKSMATASHKLNLNAIMYFNADRRFTITE